MVRTWSQASIERMSMAERQARTDEIGELIVELSYERKALTDQNIKEFKAFQSLCPTPKQPGGK